jgi:hypothetical protein
MKQPLGAFLTCLGFSFLESYKKLKRLILEDVYPLETVNFASTLLEIIANSA